MELVVGKTLGALLAAEGRVEPRALARLAEAAVLMAVTIDPAPQWFRCAEQAIRCALALDPDNASAFRARGRMLWTPARGFQHRRALRALGQALRLNPGCLSAQTWRCLVLLHIGLHEEAKRGLLTALATHPDDAFVLVFIGQAAMYQFRFEEAEEYQARALNLEPAHLWANVFYPTVPLYQNRLAFAEEKIRAARSVMVDDPWLTTCEALLWAKRGESRRALQALQRSLRGGKTLLHTHHMWHTAAAAYALLGEPTQAMKWLKKVAEIGLLNYPLFRDDPHFASLRKNPQYVRLLAGLKKQWEGFRREFGGH